MKQYTKIYVSGSLLQCCLTRGNLETIYCEIYTMKCPVKDNKSIMYLLFNCCYIWVSCDPMYCSLPGSLSMEFLRQEYWSGLPFPTPRDLTHSGIKPKSLTLANDSLPLSHQEASYVSIHVNKKKYLFKHFSSILIKKISILFKEWKDTCLHAYMLIVPLIGYWILVNICLLFLFKQKSYYCNNKKCKILQIG